MEILQPQTSPSFTGRLFGRFRRKEAAAPLQVPDFDGVPTPGEVLAEKILPERILPEKILRFVLTERLLHWALAIPFLICLSSATVLVLFYNPDPDRPYRAVFAWTHRASGMALCLLPSLVILTSGRHLRVLLDNMKQGWLWTLDDIRWLHLMPLSNVFKSIRLPDQGKFNAAEKLNFMMVTVFTPLFALTGLAIWLPEITSLDSYAPWIVHCAMAATALPLLLGHMFMATVNPATRVGLSGMVTGWVSREWAEHHYTRWYRERFPHLVAAAKHEPATPVAPPPPPSPPEPSGSWRDPVGLPAFNLSMRMDTPRFDEHPRRRTRHSSTTTRDGFTPGTTPPSERADH